MVIEYPEMAENPYATLPFWGSHFPGQLNLLLLIQWNPSKTDTTGAQHFVR